MDIKKLLDDLERRDIKLIRDKKIDEITNPNEPISKTELFINEIRDHLSTVINRDLFTNKSYFNDPTIFHIEKTCDCKTIYETETSFVKNIQVLYLIYKDDINMLPIFTNEFIIKLKKKYD